MDQGQKWGSRRSGGALGGRAAQAPFALKGWGGRGDSDVSLALPLTCCVIVERSLGFPKTPPTRLPVKLGQNASVPGLLCPPRQGRLREAGSFKGFQEAMW